jgi:hypothetical protein
MHNIVIMANPFSKIFKGLSGVSRSSRLPGGKTVNDIMSALGFMSAGAGIGIGMGSIWTGLRGFGLPIPQQFEPIVTTAVAYKFTGSMGALGYLFVSGYIPQLIQMAIPSGTPAGVARPRGTPSGGAVY